MGGNALSVLASAVGLTGPTQGAALEGRASDPPPIDTRSPVFGGGTASRLLADAEAKLRRSEQVAAQRDEEDGRRIEEARRRVGDMKTQMAEHGLPDPLAGSVTKYGFSSRLSALRNGDAAPSIAVLIKGNRAPGEVSLLSCFRVESPGTPVDSRALLFFVNDLCALTIEASRRLGLALDVCVDSATKWLVPQFIVIAAAQAKVLDDLPEQDRKVVNKLTLRAAVSAQTELLGNLVVHSGVVVAALADLAASGVSPGAAACAAQVRAAMGASAGRSFDSPPLAVTIAGFVRELAALTCWLEAFDPSATFAVPARSVEEGAWVMTQEDPACGKILAMPGTCGIAGSGGVGVLYAPVGPLYVRRDSIKAAGGITVPPLAQRALQAAWAAPSNAMGQLAVLPVGIADPDVSIAAASAPLGREKGADGAGGGHVFTASTPAFTPGAPEITFDPFAGSSAAPPPPLQPPPPQAAAAAAIADELALVLGSTVAPSPALGPGPGMHAAVTGEGAQLAGGAAAADPAAEIAAHQSEYL